MTIAEKITVQGLSCFPSRCDGFFHTGKPAYPMFAFLRYNLCRPKVCLATKPHSFMAAIVVGTKSRVHHILRHTSLPQIYPSVIRAIAVNVVNVLFRPFARHKDEGQPVRRNKAIINSNMSVTEFFALVASYFASLFCKNLPVAQNASAPQDLASELVVIQKGKNSLDRRQRLMFFDLSHFALLRRYRLEPDAGVGAPLRLVLFSTNRCKIKKKAGVRAGCWGRS
jgi:hypothetical protein